MPNLTVKLTTIEQKALKEFKDKLAKKFGPNLVMVKLFGSKARGDFHKESDLDVLVVIKNLKKQDKDFISVLSWDLLTKYSIFISEIIFSASEWETYQIKRFSLARNVEEEGVKI